MRVQEIEPYASFEIIRERTPLPFDMVRTRRFSPRPEPATTPFVRVEPDATVPFVRDESMPYERIDLQLHTAAFEPVPAPAPARVPAVPPVPVPAPPALAPALVPEPMESIVSAKLVATDAWFQSEPAPEPDPEPVGTSARVYVIVGLIFLAAFALGVTLPLLIL